MPFLDLGAASRELESGLRAAFERVLTSGMYVLSGEVPAFEGEWAAYCGARHCVGLNSGLDALHLMLAAAGGVMSLIIRYLLGLIGFQKPEMSGKA